VFALIKPHDHDDGMELLTAALLLAILGVLALAAGTDSRDVDAQARPTI
jgi:hypothetical protein